MWNSATENNFFIALGFWKTFVIQSCPWTSESLICSIHRPALFLILEFIDSYNSMTWGVKFTHFGNTLFVYAHQFFFSLKKPLEVFLWRKERNITTMEHYLVWKPTNRLSFRRQDKIRNDGCLNIRCALSLPHCFNVTLLKINLVPFCKRWL